LRRAQLAEMRIARILKQWVNVRTVQISCTNGIKAPANGVRHWVNVFDHAYAGALPAPSLTWHLNAVWKDTNLKHNSPFRIPHL
jgi:hypothetical protein